MAAKVKQVVWKHGLSNAPIGVVQEVSMPKKSVILSVQEQHGVLTVWSQHTEGKNVSNEARKFIVAYTGQPFELPTGFKFVGTAQMQGLVYHIFVK